MLHLSSRFGVVAAATFALFAGPVHAAEVSAFSPLTSPVFSAPAEGGSVALRRFAPTPEAVSSRPGRRSVEGLEVEHDPARPDEPVLVRSSPKARVVAGTAVDIRTAPWQVFLLSENATESSSCGGSILNATTVLTAAHCVEGLTIGAPFDQNGLQAFAGMSNVDVDLPTDQPQSQRVVAARVHPLYTGKLERLPEGDVAVLTLASPLDLTQPTAQPIALPASTVASVDGEPVPVGPAVKATGFGLQSGGPSGKANGQLYALDATVIDPDECGSTVNAAGLCVKSPTGSVCSGDSGGGLVAGGVLVGVVSSGPEDCSPGSWTRYTNLLVPENRQFVDNVPTVPTAPRQTTSITGSASSLSVGGTLTCTGGGFTGTGVSVKWVVSNDLGQRVAAVFGPSLSYTLAPSDAGRKMLCRAYASNAGGVATSELMILPAAVAAAPAVPAGPPAGSVVAEDNARPRISVATRRSARRGQRFKVSLRMTNLPSDTARIEALISQPTIKRSPDYKSDLYRSKFLKKVNDPAKLTAFVTMPRKAKVGRRYRVRIFATYTRENDARADVSLSVFVRATR